MHRSSDFSRRVGLLLGAVFVVAVLFVGRLIIIQVVDAETLNAEAETHRTVSRVLYGVRGDVVDANGIVLASTVDRYDITASPRYVVDFVRDNAPVTVEQALTEIAELTGSKVSELRAAVTKDPTADFTYLAKGVTLTVLRQVQALGVPWVYYDLRPTRTYPRGAVAGNLVGFMGTDGALAGIELAKDSCLAATDGVLTYAKGRDGIRIPGSTVGQTLPLDGGTIHLTIDSDLQWFAQKVISSRSKELGAEWANALIVRIEDGHIMAAADWPSVDPNNVDGSKVDDMGARLFSSPYEPGSVVKPLTAAAMIDQGLLTPVSRFTVPGRFDLANGKYFVDSFGHGTERWTTTGILVNSSNIGMNVMAEKLSKKARYDMLSSFGIGQKTAVNFLGEDSGYIATPDIVDDVTQHTELFGQGITTTTAQIASIYQTLGNNGLRQPLTLVSGCSRGDGTVTDQPQAEGVQVVSAEAADQTVSMMETVALDGWLRTLVEVEGYRIAVKSGTAEVARNGVYTDDRIISVAGVAPAENPKFAIVVVFGMPKLERTSLAVATSFATLMGQTLKYYRIPPSSGKAEKLPIEW